LSIVALLAPANWVEFAFLRESLQTSDPALSKHHSALAGAGYVAAHARNSHPRVVRRSGATRPRSNNWSRPRANRGRPWNRSAGAGVGGSKRPSPRSAYDP
jgi:hypothetical protein